MAALKQKGPCGSCTLCCTVVGVAELGKPEGVRCGHLAGGRGCAIYADRPGGCRSFACAWLVAREEGKPAPRELRPDRCHVVFITPEDRGDTLVAHVDPDHPRAWAAGPAMAHIAAMASLGTVVAVRDSGRYYMVVGDGVHQASASVNPFDRTVSLERGRRIGRIADAP